MKAYILTEDDFKKLLAAIDRDPEFGPQGGSSMPLTAKEREAHVEAHRRFNYQVRSWISEVQK